MMMKFKYYMVLCLAMLIVGFSSCDDSILEVEPTDKLTADNVFATTTSIEALRVGMYNQLGGKGSPNFYQMIIPLMGDMRGDDMVYGQRWYGSWGDMYSYNMSTESTGNLRMWENCYYITEVCNTLVSGEEQMTAVIGAELAANYVAEAKAVRGMVYYDVARFFGKAYHMDNGASKAIPYVDYIDYDAQPARDDMKTIYSKAIADLTEALPLLADIGSDTDRAYMSKYAANAVLSRIYLDMHDYAKAKDYAEAAINSAQLGLLSTEDYKLGLSNFSNEIILGFVLHAENYYKWRSFNTFFDNYDGMGDDFLANHTFFDLFGSDDIRQGFFTPEFEWMKINGEWYKYYYHLYYNGNETVDGVVMDRDFSNGLAMQSKGYYTYGKFPRSDVGYGSSRGTLGLGIAPQIRVAEIELTIAECAARLNDNALAQDKLHNVKLRSIPTSVKSTNTGQTLIDEILLERRKELFGEGHRLRDILRLGLDLVRDGSHPLHKTITAGDESFRFPVPQRELNVNPNLKN